MECQIFFKLIRIILVICVIRHATLRCIVEGSLMNPKGTANVVNNVKQSQTLTDIIIALHYYISK